MTRRYEKQRAAQIMSSDEKTASEIQDEVIELQNERIAALEKENKGLRLKLSMLQEWVRAYRRTHG
jgi:hypothetical protein